MAGGKALLKIGNGGGPGVSTGWADYRAFTDGTGCGAVDASGRIWGSYLHGIFDSDPFRRWFINRLAATVRDSVDMNRIYQLLGL